jgi:hypothetical protein
MRIPTKRPQTKVIPAKIDLSKPIIKAPLESLSTESIRRLQRKRANLDWGKDPFSIDKTKDIYTKGKLQLKGISVGKDKRGFAFINEEIVKVGDFIEGYKVLSIEKDRVLLEKDKIRFYLNLSD